MSSYELEHVAPAAAAPASAGRVAEGPLLYSYGGAMWRFRLTLLAAAAIGAAIGWWIPAQTDPYWRALSLLELAAPNEGFLQLDEVDPSADGSQSFRTRLRTQVRLLESRAVTELTIDRLTAQAPQQAAEWERAAAALSVSAMDDSRIIELSTEANQPQRAEAFLETLIAVYLDAADERREADAVATERWFDSRLLEVEQSLRASEVELQEAAREATLIPATDERRTAAEAELRRMEERLGEARARALELRASIGDGTAAGGSEPAEPLAERRRELDSLVRKRAELAAIYTPKHHALRKVEAELGAVRASLDAETERLRSRRTSSLAEAERRIELLEDERNRRLELLSEAAAAAVRFDILERQVEANRKLYQTFLEARRKAAVAVLSPTPHLRVVDPPAAGEEPVGPNPPLGALAGLLAGVGLALGVILLSDRLDRTFRRPGELAHALTARELGAIPDARFEPGPKRSTSAIGASTIDWRPEVAAARVGPSQLADSYRSMRTSLLNAAEGGRAQVWAVTSPSEGDGKTTIAANLALTMAELGRRVLLVDADLRRPRLHRIFEAGNRAGICDLLGRTPPTDAEIDRALQPMPGSDHLHLLPSGVAAFGGPGLLHSSALQALLERLRERFDLVIMDAPPALAVSDARALARAADGVVLVVRAGRTGSALAQETENLLRDDGAHLLGAVLNSWDPRQAGTRYDLYRKASEAA